MPYCDIDDLKVHNPKRTYSATTTPTETHAAETATGKVKNSSYAKITYDE